MEEKEVFKIVLTGGPCAGKSTALSKIDHMLSSLKYNTFFVPETATELLSNGVTINRLGLVNFQTLLTKHLLNKEQTYIDAANLLPNKSVIIFDRGALDAKAYVGDEAFSKIISNLNLTENNLMNRYDAVIHLKTAAEGAEQFYTNSNNAARYETAEQAREIDKKILDAWTGHGKLRIIGNYGTFDEKIEDVLTQLCSIIGIPKPLEIERKFLIDKPDYKLLEDKYNAKHYDITQDYLISNDNIERRVRKIVKPDGNNYYYTEKQDISGLSRYETEKHITKKDYLQFLKFKDPKFATINKTRHYFVYKNQCFELDTYPNLPNNAILELEMAKENQKIAIPPFINVIKEVTEDVNYKNKNMSHALYETQQKKR